MADEFNINAKFLKNPNVVEVNMGEGKIPKYIWRDPNADIVIPSQNSKGFTPVFLKSDSRILGESDIDSLKIFETRIDDEIHGADIQFEPAANAIYEKRAKEVKNIFESVIEKAFDFTTDDSLVVDVDKLNYANNATERVHRWHQAIKYKVLEKYVSLVEDREKRSKLKIDSSKSKDTIKDNFVVKSDTELEADARAAIKKTYLKRFSQLEKTFDKEKRFESFLNTITGLMDPHTDYFAPVEKRSFTEQMSGTFYGIGAQLTQDDNGVKIASIQPGGAAWKSGLLVVNITMTTLTSRGTQSLGKVI